MAARSEVVKMHQALQEREEGLRTLQEELRDAATRSQEREGRMLKELTAMGEVRETRWSPLSFDEQDLELCLCCNVVLYCPIPNHLVCVDPAPARA